MLVGDDPRALKAMFEYIYNTEYIPFTWEPCTTEANNQYAMLQWLHLLTVADKYAVDELVEEALTCMNENPSGFCKNISFNTFAYIVQLVYFTEGIYLDEKLRDDVSGEENTLNQDNDENDDCEEWGKLS